LSGATDVAAPHDRIDGREQVIAWRNIDNVGPAGAINSNVLDMAQWVRLQLGGGVYRGTRLLSAAAVQEMHTPQIVIPLDTATQRLRPSTHFAAYGLGWVLTDYRGRKIVSHGGAIDGFRAQVGLVPEERLGIVILTNGGEPGRALTVALQFRVADAYLGGTGTDWSAELLALRNRDAARDSTEEAKTVGARVAGTKPSLALPGYAGTYRNEMYGDVVVQVDSGRMVLRFGPSYTGDGSHWNYDTFKVKWRDPEEGWDLVRFSITADGKVEKLTWPGQGDFARVP